MIKEIKHVCYVGFKVGQFTFPIVQILSKIKVGGAYKNITDGWVAVDSNSSGSPDVWKKITSGNISVEDNTGDDVWVEIFK